MDESMVDIGNRIKERRKELGLTQSDFLECDITSGALSRIEKGTRTPSVLSFYKISQLLKCDMEWLISGNSAHSQNSENTDEDNLLTLYRQLSVRDKENIQELMEFKLQKSNKNNTVGKSFPSDTKNDNMVG